MDPQVLHKPTPIPDRIILTWSGDPATTQAVTWRTDLSVRNPVAELARATDGPKFSSQAQKFIPRSETLKSEFYSAQFHSVEFSGLEPDTMYAYRVGDDQSNWSEWNQFRTASNKASAPLEFVYVGDAQTDLWSMWPRVIRQSILDAPRARFIVHSGDLVNRGARDDEWGEWFMAPGWINRSISSFPTPGNHDYPSGSLCANWRPQFTLPRNGVSGLEETNYYVDVQGLRMISLNSNEKQAEQAVWLEQTLSKNTRPWVICTFHHPIYSTARGRDNKKLREAWQPIFDKYSVDMVLTGHDHTYGRTNVMSGAGPQVGSRGTVYVVSVSGPKMYSHGHASVHAKSGSDMQLYQIIRINGDKLSYEARTARGQLYDAFELIKQKGRKNQLLTRTPAVSD